ncbi:MAG: right-handed parallel beta-helix repeat-containing protein [Thermoplasmata archaeon]|nr:MAG: right-handed parallel beta-helix repeat-containing protein [Thermoplasmata archaeon]
MLKKKMASVTPPRKFSALFSSLLFFFSFFVVIDVSVDIVGNVSGDIIYVNTTGDGGAFTSIQEAINTANDGDTVFVFNGTYFENVVVNKTINLTGEDRDSTIIYEDLNDNNVRIVADFVNMSGFTLNGVTPNNGYAGIELDNVKNCTISNTLAKYNYYGISLVSSLGNVIIDNTAQMSNIGVSLYFSRDNNITGNIVSNSSFGIFLHFCSGNILTHNNVSNNSYGILIKYDGGNNITKNIISNNIADGIDIDNSNWNNITHNTIDSNSRVGIYLVSTRYTNLKNNTMMDNGIFILGGTKDLWNTHKIVTSNKLNNKPVYYWKDQTGGSVPQDAGQVILANCTDVLVTCMELDNCTVGIELGFSFNNTVHQNNVSGVFDGIYMGYSTGNNVTNNGVYQSTAGGIYLWGSDGNNVSRNICSFDKYGMSIVESDCNNIIGNSVMNNEYGLSVLRSSKNLVYHNIIINNTIQGRDDRNGNFWDIGYPLGGNFWSDYDGNDCFKGPTQNIPGTDGIGDTPYLIDSDSQDNYPLIEPYKSLGNFTILKQGWNLISIPLIQEEENLTRVLGAIDGWYDAVQWYDAMNTNAPWKHFKVNKPYGNDLFELIETMGFWIHITNPGDTIFLYNGTQPIENQTIILHEGWNLVGYPSLTSYNRTVGLNNLTYETHIDSIWTYDSNLQRWEKMGELDYFEVGKGYYIHAKSKCVWEVPL